MSDAFDKEDGALFQHQAQKLVNCARELGIDTFVGVIQTKISGRICYAVVSHNAGVMEGLGAASILGTSFRTQVHMHQVNMQAQPPEGEEDAH